MTLEKFQDSLKALADYAQDTFVMTTQGCELQVAVNPEHVYKHVGNPPRRINFKTQNEFHDAHYAWQDKVKQFSSKILVDVSQKIQCQSRLEYNAWDKPSLFLKNLFTTQVS